MSRIEKDSNLRKILGGVLDERTLKNMYTLSRKLDIHAFYGFIKQGKESSVLLARTKEDKIIVFKIYAVEGSDFKTKKTYLATDPRFANVKGSPWGVIAVWAKREFKNLHIAKAGGVRCPEPIAVRENILVLEFIGNDTNPAPRLIDYKANENIGKMVVEEMKKLYQSGIIHGDLSAYNILVHNEEPYLIDMSHGVYKRSRAAEELLKRDIINVKSYLNKIGMNITEEDIEKEVKS